MTLEDARLDVLVFQMMRRSEDKERGGVLK